MIKKIILPVFLLLVTLLIAFLAVRKPIAEKYNRKGMENYQKSEYRLAEKYFRRALQWKGNSPVMHVNLIKTLLAEDKTGEAETQLKKLADISPENNELIALRGQLMVLEDRFAEAVEQLTLAIKKDSLLSYAYYYRGIARANLNDLDGAAEDYLKARDLDKENINVLKEGAMILSKLEDYDAAIENYNKLLELDPSNTEAFLNRGNFKMKILDFEGAIKDYSDALTLDDKLAEAYFNRGKSYANTEAYESAIGDFERTTKLKFKIAGANFNSGLASLKLNRPGEAKKYLNNCIKYDTGLTHTAEAYYLLGVMEMMQNKNEKALAYYNKSLEYDRDRADTYYNRGIAHGLLNKPREAIDDLNKCLRLGMNSADVYFALGVQKISMNNFADGCGDLKTAAEMGHRQASDMRLQYCKNH
ncbi:MAG: tetratricopeptide repeat protein [Bacteroidales bacterium]|jgi:tetratricopeptide (TPR) repeat protein